MTRIAYSPILSAGDEPSRNAEERAFVASEDAANPLIIDGVTTGAWNMDAANIKQLSDGSTDVSSNGDPIGYAEDLAGNSNHLIQDNSSKKFIWEDADLASPAAEVATTRDKYLYVDSTSMGINTDTDFTLAVAFNSPATFPGGAQQLIMAYGSGGTLNSNERIALVIPSDGRMSGFFYDSATSNQFHNFHVAGTIATSSPYTVVLTYNSSTRDFVCRVNGTAGTTLNYDAARTIAADYRFGLSDVNGSNSAISMEVGTLISAASVYSSVLSGDDLSQVETELAARVGATLS